MVIVHVEWSGKWNVMKRDQDAAGVSRRGRDAPRETNRTNSPSSDDEARRPWEEVEVSPPPQRRV